MTFEELRASLCEIACAPKPQGLRRPIGTTGAPWPLEADLVDAIDPARGWVRGG